MTDPWEVASSIATVIASGAATWAASAARRSADAARDTVRAMTRPLLVLRKTQRPLGGHATSEGEYQSARYHFELKNVGPGPAIVGMDFWDGHPKLTLLEAIAELKGRRSPNDKIVVPEQEVPNVLGPGESFNVCVALGYHKRTMENPYHFRIIYSDAEGARYQATVAIVPKTGDVVGILTSTSDL